MYLHCIHKQFRVTKMTKLQSPEELAKTLGLARQTIYNRISTGAPLPPYKKIGRLVRFSSEDVEHWISELPNQDLPETSVDAEEKRRRGRPTKAEQIARRIN